MHITVSAPEPLMRRISPDKKIDVNLANFGRIPFGLTLQGPLYYESSNANACSPLNKTALAHVYAVSRLPHAFVIATRGECSFEDKVNNAQQASASFLLIVNNMPAENIHDLVMVSSNKHKVFNTSAALVSNMAGQALTSYLREDYMRGARIKLVLNLPVSKTITPSIEFLYTPTD